LYLIDADGDEQGSGNERKLVDTDFAAHHPDWHPKGTKLSFDSEFNFQGNVYVVNADGSDLHVLIEDGFWADWSPDGTQIVFASKRDGTVELYVADADGGNQRRLTENQRTEVFPAWSPDGRRIAFTVFEQRHIFVMNADGSNEQQLTDRSRSEDPAWSPDGAYVAFQSSSQGNFEIYIIHVESALQGSAGASSQRLTDNSAGDFWPTCGPVSPR
jgi:TolB protein